MQQPRRLGRGLDSLLEMNAESAAAVALEKGARVVNIPIDNVFANPEQPRKEFDSVALADLASSIQEKGVIQPILVMEKPDGTFMIIAGERRFRASKIAGKTDIPALVCNYSMAEIMEIALIENLQREDLNPMEEALAFRNLVDQFSLSQEEIAQKIGKNRSTIANSLRLLKLPESIQAGISHNKISAGHARALLSIKSAGNEQDTLYQTILAEGLSVRESEAIAQALNTGLGYEQAKQSIGSSGNQANQESSPAVNSNDENQSPDIFQLSQGATIKNHESDPKSDPTKRSPELWDLEEKLILALGTKVQIKGNNETGRIEIAYFSLDDLERIYELIAKR